MGCSLEAHQGPKMFQLLIVNKYSQNKPISALPTLYFHTQFWQKKQSLSRKRCYSEWWESLLHNKIKWTLTSRKLSSCKQFQTYLLFFSLQCFLLSWTNKWSNKKGGRWGYFYFTPSFPFMSERDDSAYWPLLLVMLKNFFLTILSSLSSYALHILQYS